MSQTNIIFGSIILAFVVFVVVRGEGPAYLSLFKHDPPATKPGGSDPLASVGGSSAWADAASALETAGQVLAFA